MTDYDWTSFSPSYAMDDWDHRSISPNTSLDWFLRGDVAVGRDLPISDALTLNVNGGVGYTDVQWTAKGGTYIYSTAGFRDTSGTIPDVPAVRYRQQLPTGFIGIDAAVEDGPWSFDTSAKAGLTVYGISTDHHYLRSPPMVITDQLGWGQVLSADARLGFAVNDHLSAYLEGSYQKVFAGHTVSDYTNMNTGASLLHYTNIGGAELDTATISAGIKGKF
jgi:plasminogen activator